MPHRCDNNGCTLLGSFEQLHHRRPHRFSNIHVGIGVLAVVPAGGAWCVLQRMRVNEADSSLELRVLCRVRDVHHRLEDLSTTVAGAVGDGEGRLSERSGHEGRVRSFVAQTQRFDQRREVTLVVSGQRGIPRVTIALQRKGAQVTQRSVTQRSVTMEHVMRAHQRSHTRTCHQKKPAIS